MRRPARDAAHPGAHLEPAERVRHVEVRRGDGGRQARPPLRDPDGRAALQHRAGPPAVGLQRLLRGLPDLQPALPAGRCAGALRGRPGDPRLRQHPRRRRRQPARARGRAGGRPGLQRRRGHALHHAEFAEVVRAQYGSDCRPRVSGEYRFGDTRHIISDIDALKQLGWTPQRTPADSVAEYADWLRGHARARRASWPRPTRRCARSAWSARRADEGLPAGRRARHPAAADHRPHAEVPGGGRWAAAARHLARRAGRRPVSTRCWSTPTTSPSRSRRTWRRASGARRSCSVVHEPELLGSAGTLRGQPDFVAGEDMFLAVNADNLTDFDLGALVEAHRAGGADRPRWRCSGPPDPTECGIVEVRGRPGGRLRGEAGASARRPGQRGPLRLRARALDGSSGRGRPRHRLPPAAPAGRPGPGGGASATPSSSTSAPPRRWSAPARVERRSGT